MSGDWGMLLSIFGGVVIAVVGAFRLLWSSLMKQVDQKHEVMKGHIEEVTERVAVLEAELFRSQAKECAFHETPKAERFCQRWLRHLRKRSQISDDDTDIHVKTNALEKRGM
jgi:uncharacterized protein YpmB